MRRRAPGVVFTLEAEPWYVEGEPGGIERALTNLLDNAAKWSPPSGTVAVALTGGTVTIDDEGSGIDDADLPHVFERFYRASESRALPGSGLGPGDRGAGGRAALGQRRRRAVAVGRHPDDVHPAGCAGARAGRGAVGPAAEPVRTCTSPRC